jgi:Ser/Thr protein kinase RdoA (MazF antagonist)
VGRAVRLLRGCAAQLRRRSAALRRRDLSARAVLLTARLADIVRGFGVEPSSIRLVAKRSNRHWRVRSGADFFALRRFGVWGRTTPGDVAWEIAAVEAYGAAGAPVPKPIAPPRTVEGQIYLMMPWLGGRVLRHPPVSEAEFFRLGVLLAEHHAATSRMPTPPQRPGFGECAKGAAPEIGGKARRDDLLAALAKVDGNMARRFGAAAQTLAARDLPVRLAGLPLRIVHGDFSTWNIKVARGRLVGLFDFDGAHVDIRATDVAFARRGYHDAVVDGYRSVRPLFEAELEALDGLWLGGVLRGLWRVLESRIAEGSDLTYELGWYLEQFDKTRPYRR